MNQTKCSLLALLLAIALQGCKNMKAAADQKVDFKDGSIPFVLTDQQMLIVSEINGNNDTMLFDIGASSTTIFDPELIQKGQFISSYKISVKLPDDSKIVSQEKIYKVRNPMFSSDNMVLHTITLPKIPCSDGFMRNLMGNKLFRHNKKILLLNFEEKLISVLQETELGSYLSRNKYEEQ